jgi:hypothetical protein
MELLQLVDVSVEEATHPLREEVATLKLLLACVGHFLEPTKGCTSSGPGLVSAQASFLPDSKSRLWLGKSIHLVVSLLVAVLARRHVLINVQEIVYH